MGHPGGEPAVAPRWRRLAVTAFVALAGLGVLGAAAYRWPPAGPTYPELIGPDVVSYDASRLPPVRNARRMVLQGARRPDGACSLSHGSPLVRPGDPVPTSRVLALDRATCRYLVEEGEHTGPVPPHPDARPTPTPFVARRIG
jgi:hypothetical protein